jgi:hypothetical protein
MSIRSFFLILIALFATTPISAAILGPYSGKVVDAETGLPLKGATVVVSWHKATPTPAGAVSDFIQASMCETREDGTYHIPASIVAIGFPSFVDGITFLAYLPGYVGFGKMYFYDKDIMETRVIKLSRLSHAQNVKERDDFRDNIFHVDPDVPETADKDSDGDPLVRFKMLLTGVPEREVLRARSDWERYFRRKE